MSLKKETSKELAYLRFWALSSILKSMTREIPLWFDSQEPLLSAVKFVNSLSDQFNWVGIYLLKGDLLTLGPYLGKATDHTQIPVGVGVCGRAVSENRDLNIPNVNLEENYLACSLETRSELVVLIRAQNNQVVGQIDIDSHIYSAFGPEKENQVKEVAETLGQMWPKTGWSS